MAFLVRYYRLGDMPPGLHYDEAFNGIDAAALLDVPIRQWPIFFTGNFGREPLFNCILASATALFGPGLMTLHLVSALVGALLTPAMIWLALTRCLARGPAPLVRGRPVKSSSMSCNWCCPITCQPIRTHWQWAYIRPRPAGGWLHEAILKNRSYGLWVAEMPGAGVREEANSSGPDTPAYSLSVALVV